MLLKGYLGHKIVLRSFGINQIFLFDLILKVGAIFSWIKYILFNSVSKKLSQIKTKYNL